MLVALGGAFAARAHGLALVALASVGCAAVVAGASFALRLPGLVAVAVVLVAAGYGVTLVRRGDEIDAFTPVFAAGLLLFAELAYWASERRAVPASRPLALHRVATVAAACLVAAVTAAMLLVVADAAVTGGLALEAAGVVAAVASVSVVAFLSARRRQRRDLLDI